MENVGLLSVAFSLVYWDLLASINGRRMSLGLRSSGHMHTIRRVINDDGRAPPSLASVVLLDGEDEVGG